MRFRATARAAASILALTTIIGAACASSEPPEQRSFQKSQSLQGEPAPQVKGAEEFVSPAGQELKVPLLNTKEARDKFIADLPGGSPEVSPLPGPPTTKAGKAWGTLPYEYVNELTTLGDWYKDRACGQAAAATALTAMGHTSYPNPFNNASPYAYAQQKLNYLLKNYKPDVAAGWLGTSWQKMQEMVSAQGGNQIRWGWNTGMDNLVRHLYNNGRNDRIAIIMMNVTGWEPFGDGVGLHWVVVYGFGGTYQLGNTSSNAEFYFSNTNGYRLSAKDLQLRWANNLLSRAAGAEGYFLWLDRP